MVRPHFKQTKENFENHAIPVGRYISVRYHSFLYILTFLPTTIDLILRLNNSLITTVILFI